MRKVLCFLIFISFTFGTTLNTEVPSDKMLEEFFKVSLLKKQLQKIPSETKKSYLEGFKQTNIEGIDLKEIEKIALKIEDAFDIEKILFSIKQRLKKDTIKQDISKLIAWNKTTLGKKILALENSSMDDMYKNSMLQKEELIKDKKLMDFCKEIDSITGITDYTLTIMKNQGIRIRCLMGCNEQTKEQITYYYDTARPELMKMNVLMLAYMYKDLSYDELERLMQFLKTPESIKVSNILAEQMVLAYDDVSMILAQEIYMLVK